MTLPAITSADKGSGEGRSNSAPEELQSGILVYKTWFLSKVGSTI